MSVCERCNEGKCIGERYDEGKCINDRYDEGKCVFLRGVMRVNVCL